MVHIDLVETRLDRFAVARPELARPHPSGKLVCVACAHRCKLQDGSRGVCLVRSRRGNDLMVPWGYSAGVAVDPVEKKPFFHFLPGSLAYSIATIGCNFHCLFCRRRGFAVLENSLRDGRCPACRTVIAGVWE